MPDPVNGPVSPPVPGSDPQPPATDPNVPPQQEPAVEPQDLSDPDDKVLNKLRSWQGRREKEFEDRIFSRMAELLNRPQQPPANTIAPASVTEEAEPDVYTQPKEWVEWRDRQVVKAKQDAERVYFGSLHQQGIRHPDETVHAAVIKELNDMGHSNNLDPATGKPCPPAIDAMLNYNRALNSVLQKRLVPGTSPRVNPLENNQPPAPGLGVSSPGTADPASTAVMPRNLSPHAQKLIRHAGWNADKVRQVLGK